MKPTIVCLIVLLAVVNVNCQQQVGKPSLESELDLASVTRTLKEKKSLVKLDLRGRNIFLNKGIKIPINNCYYDGNGSYLEWKKIDCSNVPKEISNGLDLKKSNIEFTYPGRPQKYSLIESNSAYLVVVQNENETGDVWFGKRKSANIKYEKPLPKVVLLNDPETRKANKFQSLEQLRSKFSEVNNTNEDKTYPLY